jgi:arylsulfatase A-like enzyme
MAGSERWQPEALICSMASSTRFRMGQNRRLLLGALLLAPLLAMARPPNVVMIVTDDQGWGDLSISGNTNLATPHIDSLATAGATLARFHVQPVCSPTRAEILTGRYAVRSGVYDTSAGGERLNLDERTIADVFKAAGYATGAFGKWHNGEQYPYHPNGRGFDEFYGFCSGHWGDYFDAPLEHNGKAVQSRGYLPDDLTDHALAFIAAHQNQPFFCYVPLNTPHSPLQVPDAYYAKFAGAGLALRAENPAEENVDFTRAVLAMCENIDWNVGRILGSLKSLGLADDTIVIYFSDNGPNATRWNGGMKGIKGSVDEGGVRSPCFVRWPDRIPAGTTIESLVGAIDLLPTLADCAGIPVTGTKPLDGISVKPLLMGQRMSAANDRLLFSHWAGRSSVRSATHRLDHAGHLFDLTSDPGQKRDVAKMQPDRMARLSAALLDWKNQALPVAGARDRPLPVGYRQHPITRLPAADGIPEGGVRRSNRYPNCSYFENWTKTTDVITWDVEVATPGRYEVVLNYACTEADIGSRLRLECLGRTLESQVEIAHDVPLRGGEHDRIPRIESYVKDFGALSLGVVELPAGRDRLKLTAPVVAGREVMELSALRLRLLD